MLWPKKNSYKEFDNEKKFLRLENPPPPPHNFSNGPSLTGPKKKPEIESTLMTFWERVYSYFEKGCQKKGTRQSRKVLWVLLIFMFFKDI